MCRLFGLHAGAAPVPATFWLLDAPDSLDAQSHANPDGAGIGVFDVDGRPVVDKQPLAAWRDTEFATAAHDLRGTTFVAHVRYASTGALTMVNTHPFLQDGRLFAHNGVVAGLPALDARLADLARPTWCRVRPTASGCSHSSPPRPAATMATSGPGSSRRSVGSAPTCLCMR